MYRWERVADIDGKKNKCTVHCTLYGIPVIGEQDRVDISAPIRKKIKIEKFFLFTWLPLSMGYDYDTAKGTHLSYAASVFVAVVSIWSGISQVNSSRRLSRMLGQSWPRTYVPPALKSPSRMMFSALYLSRT